MSSLLALASSDRKRDTLRHLEAEGKILKQVFAFDHQNYMPYLTYQDVLLSDLQP